MKLLKSPEVNKPINTNKNNGEDLIKHLIYFHQKLLLYVSVTSSDVFSCFIQFGTSHINKLRESLLFFFY